jgi:hypothetical protein
VAALELVHQVPKQVAHQISLDVIQIHSPAPSLTAVTVQQSLLVVALLIMVAAAVARMVDCLSNVVPITQKGVAWAEKAVEMALVSVTQVETR